MNEQEPTPDETDDATLSVELSRRTLVKGLTVAAATGTGSAYVLTQGSTEAAAFDNISWNVTSEVETTTADGTITDVTVDDGGDTTTDAADEDRGILLDWSNFSDPTDVDIYIETRLTDTTQDFEPILSGMVSIETTPDGEDGYMWETVFETNSDETLPGSVTDHSAISASDFEAEEDGEREETDVDLRIRVEAVGNDAAASETKIATVIVNNDGATIEVGGEGKVEIKD